MGLLARHGPWQFALLGALVAAGRGFRAGTISHRHRWLLLWVAISALPFLTMKTFERYLIPLAVPGCLLTAHYLSVVAREAAVRAHLVAAVALLGVPTLAFAGFGLWFGTGVVGPAVGLVGFAALVVLTRRQAAPDVLVPAIAAQMALVLGITYPSLGVNALPDGQLPPDELPFIQVQSTFCVLCRFPIVGHHHDGFAKFAIQKLQHF